MRRASLRSMGTCPAGCMCSTRTTKNFGQCLDFVYCIRGNILHIFLPSSDWKKLVQSYRFLLYCIFFSDLGALFSESCKFSAVQYHICVLQTDREASSAEGVLPCFTRNTVKMWSPEHFRSFVGCHCSTAHRGYSTVLYMISTPDHCTVVSSPPFCHRVEVFFFAQMSLGSEKLMFFWKPYLWESLSIKPSLPKNFCLTLWRGLTVNLQYRITTV